MAADAPSSPRPADTATTNKGDDAPPNKAASPEPAGKKDVAENSTRSDKMDVDADATTKDKDEEKAAAAKQAEEDDEDKTSVGNQVQKEAAGEASSKTETGSAAEPKSAKKATGTPKGPTKKKSAANLKSKTPKKNADLKLDPGNHVLAKMRSYPPWPAIILSEETLPSSLKNGPPKGGKVPSEGWKTHYPVMFLGTYEYAWTGVADLDLITDEKKEKGPSKKNKTLSLAFEQLGEGFTLVDVKEFQESGAAAEALAEEEVDEMEIDEEEEADSDEGKPKKASKKRKASSDDEVESDKPAKTPKKETKGKAKTPKSTAKTPSNGVSKSASKPKGSEKKDKKTPVPKGDKKKATPSSSTKRGTKAKSTETVHSESDEADGRPVDPSTLDDGAKRDLMMHRRHKLQKAFLNKDGVMPSDDDMPALSECLTSLEKWANLDAKLIQETKINKVLKGIIKLAAIPRDEEFQFKSRSAKLFEQWNTITGATPKAPTTKKENGVASEKAEEKVEEKPVANGEKADKDEDVDMKDADKSVEVRSDKPNEVTDAKGEKDKAPKAATADEKKQSEASTASEEKVEEKAA